MESIHEELGIMTPSFNQYGSDFGLIDFMDEANLDQFIDLIRGDNDIHETEAIFNLSNEGYDYNQDHHGLVCNLDPFSFPPLAPPPPPPPFEFDNNEVDEDDSSGSGTTTTLEASKKSDRSRTLISERRRRNRMKEKLYALRALVPNITKMDKASIVGDAVLYVQDLQMQAKKLKSEVANLETSLIGGDKMAQNNHAKKMSSFYPVIKKIFKIDVFEVEERGFYVKIVSNKGKGVAVLLYRLLESLTSFNVRSSNLATSADNYVFTFTLHTMEGEMDVSLQNLKLWIASVFLNQGFEFQTSQSA